MNMKPEDVISDIQRLQQSSTMQLRRIAKVLHVKYYSRLKREDLILAIIAKKNELQKRQQLELFETRKV